MIGTVRKAETATVIHVSIERGVEVATRHRQLAAQHPAIRGHRDAATVVPGQRDDR